MVDFMKTRTRFTQLYPVLFPHANLKRNNRLTENILLIDDVIPLTSLCSIIVW